MGKDRQFNADRSCGMNTREIFVSLRYLPLATTGVYAADEIPRTWARPAGLIVNTDDHNKPGEHWVAMYVDRDGRGSYFDSYGLPPIIPQHVAGLRRNCKFYRHNLKQLQSDTSDVCGQFCIVFLHLMSFGSNLAEFNSLFSSDVEKNDKIVREYYNAFSSHGTLKKNNKNGISGGGFSERRMACMQRCCIRR